MNTREARKLGYRVRRGSYYGTCDDRADRWYVDHVDSECINHCGPGFPTRADALLALEYELQVRAALQSDTERNG